MATFEIITNSASLIISVFGIPPMLYKFYLWLHSPYNRAAKLEIEELSKDADMFNDDTAFRKFLLSIQKEKIASYAFGRNIQKSEIQPLMEYHNSRDASFADLKAAWDYRKINDKKSTPQTPTTQVLTFDLPCKSQGSFWIFSVVSIITFIIGMICLLAPVINNLWHFISKCIPFLPFAIVPMETQNESIIFGILFILISMLYIWLAYPLFVARKLSKLPGKKEKTSHSCFCEKICRFLGLCCDKKKE